jgi:Putative amidase domain
MRNIFKDLERKKILLVGSYFLIPTLLISNFIFFISKTSNSYFVPSCLFSEGYETEPIANVGTFITDIDKNVEASIILFLNNLYSTRNEAFVTGNVEELYKFYDTSQTFSSYSLKHEFKRIAYLRDWANERNISFKSIESIPQIKNLKIKDNTYKLTSSEEYKFDYVYNDTSEKINNFGVSLIHTLELQTFGNSYIITKDYYQDCFEGGLENYDFNLTEKIIPLTKFKSYNLNFNIDNSPKGSELYNREAAVNYANKYSGISFSTNLNNKYNSNYYTYEAGCGNCTNFVSQCLGDYDEGGKMPQDKDWSYKYNNSKGVLASQSWVNAEKLLNHLLSTNKAFVSFSGSFENVLNTMDNSNNRIKLGDLVIYKNGDYIEHSAIITGFDNSGYPLINSNSIDKYKVPFDLGWSNKNSEFYIISLK